MYSFEVHRLARYGWPFAQCQSSHQLLMDQLENGIRVIDVRLSVIDNEHLIAYHGIVSQRVSFPAILQTIHDFLSQHPQETLVVSIKQEDSGAVRFNQLLTRDIETSEGGWAMWFLESGRVPKLGEVRGRCVLLSRFGGTSEGWPNDRGLGIHPVSWPDSVKGFEWWYEKTLIRVQDW
jgi:1-phosphatidylinositol phosphodiesterase